MAGHKTVTIIIENEDGSKETYICEEVTSTSVATNRHSRGAGDPKVVVTLHADASNVNYQETPAE